MSLISDFISKVQSIHATGNATEHSYRSAFETLFAALGDAFKENLIHDITAQDFADSRDFRACDGLSRLAAGDGRQRWT